MTMERVSNYLSLPPLLENRSLVNLGSDFEFLESHPPNFSTFSLIIIRRLVGRRKTR